MNTLLCEASFAVLPPVGRMIRPPTTIGLLQCPGAAGNERSNTPWAGP
jgi:hypothetical protein